MTLYMSLNITILNLVHKINTIYIYMNNDSCTLSVQQSYNTPLQGVGPTV